MAKRRKTLDLPQPLHVTPTQDQALRRLWEQVLLVQLIVTTFLRLRTAENHVTLLDVARAVQGTPCAPPLPPLPHGTALVRVPRLDDVPAVFRIVRDELGWARTVPASVLGAMLTETLGEWRALGVGEDVPVAYLPAPWPVSRPPLMHCDHAVQVVDDITVEIAALGAEARVITDVTLMPRRYLAALRYKQARRLASEAAELEQDEHAWLAGDVQAGARAFRRRARLEAAGLSLDGQVPPPEPPAGEPVLRERTVVRHVTPEDGPPRWEVVWRFDVTDVEFPQWSVDDTIGLDPGEIHVVGYASENLAGVLPRPFPSGIWEAPALPPSPGQLQLPYDVARAHARHRLALYRRLMPVYEQMLDVALQHRLIALEDVSWRGFGSRPGSFSHYAQDCGLKAALGWLRLLAPLHGASVRLTPARDSTRTCSRCERLGTRPQPGRPFRCQHADCRHAELSDVNAARVHRARAMQGQGRDG